MPEHNHKNEKVNRQDDAQDALKRKRKKRRRRKLIIWLASVLFVLLVILPLLANIYADRIFGETVREIIRTETNRKYDFRYADINFNLFYRSLVVEQLLIYPDSSYLQHDTLTDQPLRRYFELQIPQFRLTGAGILNMLLNKKLEINTIFIGKPSFRLVIDETAADTAKTADTTQKKEFNFRRLHTFVADYLSLLQIDEFELNQGNFVIRRKQTGDDRIFEVRNFSVSLLDFYLDSIAHQEKERLFFSDSLGFSLKDGYLHFKSRLHEIALKDIELSSTDGTLVIEDLEISSDTSRLNREQQGWLDLKIPQVKLTGLDFDKTLSQQVELDEMLISQAEIMYHPPAKSQHSDLDRSEVARRIYKEISNYFEPVEIQKLSLEHASFRIAEFESNILDEFYLPDISLTLHRIMIDSASFAERSPVFFVDDISLSLVNQQFGLKKAGYLLSFDQFDLGTQANEILIGNLSFTPMESAVHSTQAQLQVPRMIIRGSNFKKDFIEGALTLDIVEIDAPDADIRRHFQDQSNAEAGMNVYHLYPEISGYLQWIRLEKLLIQNADVTFTDLTGQHASSVKAHPLRLAVYGFELDGTGPQARIFYSDDIRAEINNLSWDFPDAAQKLFAARMQFSTAAQEMTLQDVRLDTLAGEPDQGHLLLDIENLSLSEIDFYNLYRHRKYLAGHLAISRSDVQILLGSAKAEGSEPLELPAFTLGDLTFDEGVVSIFRPGGSEAFVSAEDVAVMMSDVRPSGRDSGPALMFDGGNLAFSDLEYLLPDSLHRLKIGTFGYGTEDSRLRLFDVALNPVKSDSSKTINLYETSAGEILWEDFRAMDFYTQNKLTGGLLQILNPSAKIFADPAAREGKGLLPLDEEHFKSLLLGLVEKLEVDAIKMLGADLQLYRDRRFRDTTVVFRGGEIDISEIYVDENSVSEPDRLLFASDIKVHFDEIRRLSAGNSVAFSLDSLGLSTAGEFLKASAVAVNQPDTATMQTVAEGSGVFLSELEMSGMDYYQLLVNRKFKADSVGIARPVILLERQTSNEDQSQEDKKIDVRALISKELEEISVEDMDVVGAKLQLENFEGDDKETYLFMKIDFDIKHLLIDSTNRVLSNIFFYSDDMDFTVHDFQHTSADSLYDYGAAYIRFNSSNMLMVVDSGFLSPNFGDKEFARRVGVQTDRMSLLIDRLEMHNFRLNDLILYDKLHIDKVLCDRLIGEDYRDKAFPLPDNHYPSLPATALRRLDFTFRLDTLLVKNSRFTYREYVEPALQPGKIWFTGIDVAGRNITNDPGRIELDSTMRFSASGRLMGEADLNLFLTFTLTGPTNHFYATGVINSLDLTELNPALEHLAFLKVKKGRNQMLDFNFYADDSLSRGSTDFEYERLKIRLIDKKTLRDKGIGESIASFIANTFVVRKNNPKLILFKRKGDIYFQRDVHKSFFNYLVKSVLSGVESTIRGGNEERKEIRTKRKLKKQLPRERKPDEFFDKKSQK